jgi:hypothetical protein
MVINLTENCQDYQRWRASTMESDANPEEDADKDSGRRTHDGDGRSVRENAGDERDRALPRQPGSIDEPNLRGAQGPDRLEISL